MHQMQSADANLLLALDALLRTGSVTRAARSMNVSPPAMSHTLSRLRAALGDPLFVRSGNRLVPTPRALAMRERVSRAAAEIGALLRPEQPLELATLERTFIIRASDATIVTLGHALDVLVRREAPGVALHFIGSLLAEGLEVDLDIGVQYGLAPELRISVLYQEEMVPVVRKDHPLATRRVTAARLAALDQIAGASQRAKLDELTRPRRRQRNPPPSRIVPSFLAAAALVRASDAYTLLPNRLATVIFDTFGLCRLSVSGTPTKVAIAQAWSPRFESDAGHTWLRGCVRRACGSAEEGRASARAARQLGAGPAAKAIAAGQRLASG
jgi:DNA-binding transcriptional LysR family regulator